MKTQKPVKKIPYLDYECVIGEKVQWNNIKGEHFIGTLVNIDDDDVATVKLSDGTLVKYQC